jgi:hypothetical protein
MIPRALLPFVFVAALFFAFGRVARAEPGITWLPGPARAIPRGDSASRDVAAFEVAYGPRAQTSIGAEPGLLESRGTATSFRFGTYGVYQLENATSTRLLPATELWRGLFGLTLAWELHGAARAWLPKRSALEVALVFGYEDDDATANSTAAPNRPSQRAIPFGGGGVFVSPDVALRLPLGRRAQVTMRLADRVYINAFPLMFGARVASDAVADFLHEGLVNAASSDIVFSWRATGWLVPKLGVYAEHLFARDRFVQDGAYLRAMLGCALPGRVGELEPFVAVESGNGKGLLIDRRESRASLGIRYAFF